MATRALTQQPALHALPASGAAKVSQENANDLTLLAPAVVIGVIVAGAVNDPIHPLASVLIGATTAMLVLSLKQPAWGLGALVVSEISLGGYMIPSLAMTWRLISSGIAMLLLLRFVLTGDFMGDSRVRRVLVPAVVLVFTATAVNALFENSDYVTKYLRYQMVQLFALMVAAVAVRDVRSLRSPCIVVVGIAVLSSLAAVMQHYSPEGALYGAGTLEVFGAWKGRSLGLSTSPVVLANQLVFVLLPLLGFLVCHHSYTERASIMLIVASMIVLGGLYFTYTRSALLAVGPGLLMMALLMRGVRRTQLMSVVIGAAVMYQLLQGSGLIGARYYRDASNDRSASSHWALWQVGLAVALANPIVGIGHRQFEDVSADYAGVVSVDLSGPGGEGAVGKQRPHNDFLSVWLSWGIVALVSYTALFVGALRNCADAARREEYVVCALALGTAGTLITYAVNSLFHNSLDSSTLLFIFAGLSAGLTRIPALGRRSGRSPRAEMLRIARGTRRRVEVPVLP